MVNSVRKEFVTISPSREVLSVKESGEDVSIEMALSNIEDLNKRLHEEVFGTFWGKRLIRGIYDSGGNCKRVALLAAVCAGIFVYGGTVYTLGEGVHQIFKFAANEIKSVNSTNAAKIIDAIPSISGHTGEWLGEIIVDTYVSFSELSKLMREGDFAKTKRIYKKIVQEHKHKWEISELYRHILHTFDYLGRLCLSPKNNFDQRLQAIEIMKKVNTNTQPCKELDLDRKLERIYKKIQRDLKTELTYRKRFSKGFQVIGKNHGKIAQFTAVFTGVILSVALLALCIFPIAGVGFIGRDVRRGDLTIIGHMGEWLAAGIGFIFMARYLNKSYIARQGDLQLAREVMLRYINKYNEIHKLHKRLISICNDELDHYAHDCGFTTLPSTYRFG